jgi:hypothetical protein
MFTKSPVWYRNAAIAGLTMAVLMIPALEALQHAQLSAWIHIPLMVSILNAMGGGSIVAGVCFYEYQQRAKNVKNEV